MPIVGWPRCAVRPGRCLVSHRRRSRVVSDNGPCFRGEVCKTAFAGPDPLLRHLRTRVRSPQTNGVIERFFGTLKYEHLFRGAIADGHTLDMEVHRFRVICSTIRPHQEIDDQVPRAAFRQL
ncbi:integrase core domain-containing protein [Nocardia sp. NPDC047038]|uniref:integrase core domain-containing protein n=1 Tax=Nocardia sp. NPDC047038 TaxID=3154338 RepID=UPI00340F0502